MIDLHYWTTPNGHKVTMFLEEAGLHYRIIPVNISAGDQFKPDFLAIAPNNRIPAIVDHEPADGGAPVSLFESGAILLYLADKIRRFVPPTSDIRGRAGALQWLFWQMGGLGPMAGQNHHFSQYAPEKIPYAINRYVNETGRLYGGRRLLHRRHGELPLDRAACAAGPGHLRIPASRALVRRHQGAPCDRARLCPRCRGEHRTHGQRRLGSTDVRPDRRDHRQDPTQETHP